MRPALCLLLAILSGCSRSGFGQPADARLAADLRDQHAADAPRDLATDLAVADRSSLENASDLHAIKDTPGSDKPVTTDKLPIQDATSAKDKPLVSKDLAPAKDTASAKDKPLVSKDTVPAKEMAKPDLKPGESPPLNPNGSYGLTPTVTYKCAVGLVDFTINLASFVDDGSKLTVTTGPTGPAGGCAVLVGDTAYDGSFTATCTFLGSCNEVYTLSGSFAGNTWSGSYSAVYTGSCLNCTNHTWPVTANRK